MPSEMIVGKIEFTPVAMDTYSAGRQIEFDRLLKENARLKEKLQDARERFNKGRALAIELGYAGMPNVQANPPPAVGRSG